MKTILLSFSLFILCFSNQVLGQKQSYQQDLQYYLQTIKDNYPYFDKKLTNWQRVSESANKNIHKVTNNRQFVSFLEQIQFELYDNHIHLLTNNSLSPKLVPSSSDAIGQYSKSDGYRIINLFPDSPAFKQLQIHDQILSIDNQPIEQAIEVYLGKSFNHLNEEIKTWAFNLALTGRYHQSRLLGVLRNGKTLQLELTEYKPHNQGLFEHKILANNIAYIRLNNSLGQQDLLTQFKPLITSILNSDSLVLDLRNTPSGGNSPQAKAIMGHFIDKDQFYQKHEAPQEEKHYGTKRSWVELVSPIEPYYSKPIVVLVNQWTASMGEGIAIGLDGMGRATVIGSPMAKLRGSMYDFFMPNSKIGFKISTQRMYHVNGTPREDYNPSILIEPTSTDSDQILDKAIQLLSLSNNKK